MAVGDTTAESIIWVPGEATGTNYVGASVVVPSGNLSADEADVLADAETYADAAVDALHDRLVASGVLPN